MVFADSNRGGIYYIEETTFDITPSSGVTRSARITGSTLSASKDTVVSDELRADRMVSDVVEVAAMSGGDLSIEHSMFAHDDWYEGFLAGTWTRDQYGFKFAGITLSFTNTNELTISGVDYSNYFIAGRRVKTEGWQEAANNRYWQISTSTFTGGDTVLVFTDSEAVAESGGTTAAIHDANDVIVLNDPNIRVGSTAANQIDSNSNNSFAAAITAGQLSVGQFIFLEGLGYESGTIEISTNPTDTHTVTISDGLNSVTFEFDSNSSVTSGNVSVTIGGSAAATAANLEDAINAQRVLGNLECTATLSSATVTVRNVRILANGVSNATNGTIDEADYALGTDVVITDFSGGAVVRGFFELTAVANDVLTVTPTPVANANGGGLDVTIKGGMIRNPGTVANITPRSYTVETQFTDIGQYMVQRGNRVGGFNLEVEAGSIVTGSFSFMGTETEAMVTSPVLSASPYTPIEAANFDVVNATTNVGSLTKDGATLSSALQSISITGDASLRNQMKVSSKFPAGIGLGRFSLEGTFTAYFENQTLFNHFLDHDTIAMGWRFTDLQSNHQIWTVPALKLNSDPVAPEGIDQDVMETLEFTAFREATRNCMLQIDRFGSTAPTTRHA